MPILHIRVASANDLDNDSGTLDPVYIAGFCVAGAVMLGLAIWLVVSLLRKRSRVRRQSVSNGAFLTVRGLVKDGVPANPEPPTFSRLQIDSSVTFPDRVLPHPPRFHTSDEVIAHHRRSGTYPKPFSFALSVSTPDQARRSANPRESWFSSRSSQNRFSVYSSNSSVYSAPTVGSVRKVRQVYDPVLPDEILIRVGDSLTLVQSFDDGWCLVGRENASFVAHAKYLFRPNTVVGNGDIELGVVPAWCFIRPAPGLTATRPIRNTSLGLTVKMNTSDGDMREDVISWSNF
ncbi:hypothetical protein H0H92_007472 [Tricholoma furcatifolium]|nr:hypothetical protein H0H92_007472 [Tricholoma furcatifolium]